MSYGDFGRSLSAVSPNHFALYGLMAVNVLVFGLIVAALAGVAVWLQVAVLLWGRKDRRFPLMTLEWPEEAGSRLEGKERLTLEDTPAEPQMPPALAAQPQSNPAE